MSDPIEQLQRLLTQGGWDILSQMGPKLSEEQAAFHEEMLSEAAIFADCAATPQGAAMIDLLVRRTVLRPPEEAELHPQGMEVYALQKAKREGQNSIVFMILQAIYTANDGKVRHDRRTDANRRTRRQSGK